MTTPDPHDPNSIADTGMFRAFVAQPQSEPPAKTGLQKLWVWPGLLVPTLLAIGIVVLIIILVTN